MQVTKYLTLLLALDATAHELQDNRATLVLRDKTHLSVTLYVAYPEALHRALAPQRPLEAFLLVYSAMKPEDLERDLLRVQAKFQAAIRLSQASGGDIALTNWVWPDLKQVQAILQQRVMQLTVDPNRHAHEAPVEIRAEANARQEIAAVRIQFPDEFQKVLVVSYRPSQIWVEPKTASAPIKF